ncbi:DUF4492 domain-containing protein [Candidatus Gracilibacteria bacterium]|nr:DUF4492 domain-containing protein [Candidatus Gracilibacteria bacterium]
MHFLRSVFFFYYNGLRNMTIFGRSLWKIIIFKVILLVILANFLLPNFLRNNFDNDVDRANHVGKELLEQNK